MRAPKGQKAAAKAGRSAAAPTAAAPSTQLDDLPDSVLGLIFSFAPDSSGPSIRAVSRRWRRVWLSEPELWREFELLPMPPPEAALRLHSLELYGTPTWPWDSYSDEESSDFETESNAGGGFWDYASHQRLSSAFAARRRELQQTAHYVTQANLQYAHSLFQQQAVRRGGWQLAQVLRALPAGLQALNLDSYMEADAVGKAEAKALAAATSDALARFPHLTVLQLHVNVLPKSTAAALARLTGLSGLQVHARGITQPVVDSALGCSRLTSLMLHASGGLLPTQRLTQLPQRLPLLAILELSDGVRHGDDVEDVQLPGPADSPHLRTFQFNFEDGRRRFRIGDVPLAACSYQEERQAGGGPPMYKRRMDAADGRIHLQWQAGPLQGQLQVSGATLPASTSLQQLLERLLPPSGLSLGALRLESCRLTPAQCGACPLLEPVNDLEVVYQRFLPDGHTAAEAEEFSFDGHPRPPPQGSPADLARQAALEPVLAALLAQMPTLERLHCGGLPTCVVQRTGLRSLNLNGASLETLPHGPYLQSLETLLLDGQGFERLPPALAAATRCRYLSLEMCYHMSITNRDVDNILVKMAALQVLRLNKHESWNPYSYPRPLLRYIRERMPHVHLVMLDPEDGGGSGLTDDDGSESDGGGSSGWDGESDGGSNSGWDSDGSGEEEEDAPPPAGGRVRAGSRRQACAGTKPATRGRAAARGRTAAGAAKGKGKQPAKGKAAVAKPRATAKGKGAQGKGKQQQQQKQPARKCKGGK